MPIPKWNEVVSNPNFLALPKEKQLSNLDKWTNDVVTEMTESGSAPEEIDKIKQYRDVESTKINQDTYFPTDPNVLLKRNFNEERLKGFKDAAVKSVDINELEALGKSLEERINIVPESEQVALGFDVGKYDAMRKKALADSERGATLNPVLDNILLGEKDKNLSEQDKFILEKVLPTDDPNQSKADKMAYVEKIYPKDEFTGKLIGAPESVQNAYNYWANNRAPVAFQMGKDGFEWTNRSVPLPEALTQAVSMGKISREEARINIVKANKDAEKARQNLIDYVKQEQGVTTDAEAMNFVNTLDKNAQDTLFQKANINADFGSNILQRALAKGWLGVGSSLAGFMQVVSPTKGMYDYFDAVGDKLEAMNQAIPQPRTAKELNLVSNFSPSAIRDFAVGSFGEQAPSFATAMLGGAIGQFATEAVAGAKWGKQLAQANKALRQAELSGNPVAIETATKSLSDLQKSINTTMGRGSFYGAALNSIPQEIGSIYRDMPEDQKDRAVASIGGIVAGMFDAIVPSQMVGKGLTNEVKKASLKNFLTNVGKNVGEVMTKEPLPETAQTAIENFTANWANENFDNFSEENLKAMTDTYLQTLFGMPATGVYGGASETVAQSKNYQQFEAERQDLASKVKQMSELQTMKDAVVTPEQKQQIASQVEQAVLQQSGGTLPTAAKVFAQNVADNTEQKAKDDVENLLITPVKDEAKAIAQKIITPTEQGEQDATQGVTEQEGVSNEPQDTTIGGQATEASTSDSLQPTTQGAVQEEGAPEVSNAPRTEESTRADRQKRVEEAKQKPISPQAQERINRLNEAFSPTIYDANTKQNVSNPLYKSITAMAANFRNKYQAQLQDKSVEDLVSDLYVELTEDAMIAEPKELKKEFTGNNILQAFKSKRENLFLPRQLRYANEYRRALEKKGYTPEYADGVYGLRNANTNEYVDPKTLGEEINKTFQNWVSASRNSVAGVGIPIDSLENKQNKIMPEDDSMTVTEQALIDESKSEVVEAPDTLIAKETQGKKMSLVGQALLNRKEYVEKSGIDIDGKNTQVKNSIKVGSVATPLLGNRALKNVLDSRILKALKALGVQLEFTSERNPLKSAMQMLYFNSNQAIIIKIFEPNLNELTNNTENIEDTIRRMLNEEIFHAAFEAVVVGNYTKAIENGTTTLPLKEYREQFYAQLAQELRDTGVDKVSLAIYDPHNLLEEPLDDRSMVQEVLRQIWQGNLGITEGGMTLYDKNTSLTARLGIQFTSFVRKALLAMKSVFSTDARVAQSKATLDHITNLLNMMNVTGAQVAKFEAVGITGTIGKNGITIANQLFKTLNDAYERVSEILNSVFPMGKGKQLFANKDRIDFWINNKFIRSIPATVQDVEQLYKTHTGKRVTQEQRDKLTAFNVEVSNAPITTQDDARYLELAKDPEKNREELQRMVDEAARPSLENRELFREQNNLLNEKAEQQAKESMYNGNGKFTNAAGISYLITPSVDRDVLVRVTRIGETGQPIGHNDFYDEEMINSYLKNQNIGGLINAIKYTMRPDLVEGWQYNMVVARRAATHAFKYRLRLRDATIGTHPQGGIITGDRTVEYNRPLTFDELDRFEMTPIGAKKADVSPVTYDSQGNIIPLSQRFNPERPEITNAPRTPNAQGSTAGSTLEDIEPAIKKARAKVAKTSFYSDKAYDKARSLIANFFTQGKSFSAMLNAIQQQEGMTDNERLMGAATLIEVMRNLIAQDYTMDDSEMASAMELASEYIFSKASERGSDFRAIQDLYSILDAKFRVRKWLQDATEKVRKVIKPKVKQAIDDAVNAVNNTTVDDEDLKKINKDLASLESELKAKGIIKRKSLKTKINDAIKDMDAVNKTDAEIQDFANDFANQYIKDNELDGDIAKIAKDKITQFIVKKATDIKHTAINKWLDSIIKKFVKLNEEKLPTEPRPPTLRETILFDINNADLANKSQGEINSFMLGYALKIVEEYGLTGADAAFAMSHVHEFVNREVAQRKQKALDRQIELAKKKYTDLNRQPLPKEKGEPTLKERILTFIKENDLAHKTPKETHDLITKFVDEIVAEDGFDWLASAVAKSNIYKFINRQINNQRQAEVERMLRAEQKEWDDLERDFNKSGTPKKQTLRSKITEQIRLSNLVNKTSEQIGDFAVNLANALVSEYGMTGTEADTAAKRIIGFINKNVNEKKAKALEKWINANKDRDGMKPLVLNVDRLKRLVAIGAFSDVNAMNIIAQSLGFPHVKVDVMKKIEQLSENLANAEAGMPTFIANKKLLEYIKSQEKHSILSMVFPVWVSNLLLAFRTATANIVPQAWNAAEALIITSAVKTIQNKDATLFFKALENLWNNRESIIVSMSSAWEERGGAIAEDYERASSIHSLARKGMLDVEFFGKKIPEKFFTAIGKYINFTLMTLGVPDALFKKIGSTTQIYFEQYERAKASLQSAGMEPTAKQIQDEVKKFEYTPQDIALFRAQAEQEFKEGKLSYNDEHKLDSKRWDSKIGKFLDRWFGKKGQYNTYKENAIKARVDDLKLINLPIDIIAPAHIWAKIVSFQNPQYGLIGIPNMLLAQRVTLKNKVSFVPSQTKIGKVFTVFMNTTVNVLHAAIGFAPILNASHILHLLYPNTAKYTFSEHFYEEFDPDTETGLTPTMRATLLGRATLGYLALGILAFLITLSYELDPDDPWFDIYGGFRTLKKDKLNLLRKNQYTLKFGDTLLVYKDMPFGMCIGMLGNLLDIYKYDRLDEDGNEKSAMQMIYESLAVDISMLKDVGPLANIQQLMGGQTQGSDVSEGMEKNIFRAIGNIISGGLAQEVKNQYSIWIDDQIYRSNVAWKNMFRSIPMLNKTLMNPALGQDGEPLREAKLPWSRLVKFATDDPYFSLLEKLARSNIIIKDVTLANNTIDEDTQFAYTQDYLRTLKQELIDRGLYDRYQTDDYDTFKRWFDKVQEDVAKRVSKDHGIDLIKKESTQTKKENISESYADNFNQGKVK